jgi:hypothetical protein
MPKENLMASLAQIAANQQNALNSTGPKSAEGKARVALNGVTHGLTGKFVLLDGESQEALDRLIARLQIEHQPEGECERFLVRHIGELQFRLTRAAGIETQLMNYAINPDSPCDSPDAAIARAFFTKGSFDEALLRLNRYENSLRRGYLAALHELRQLQTARKRGITAAQLVRASVQSKLSIARNPPAALTPSPDKANPIPPAVAPSDASANAATGLDPACC